jgi:membrane protein DedA with SNARE-associated domain
LGELQNLLDWVAAYGAPALGLLLMLGIAGLPVPDETLLVFCGYLIYRGTFQAHTTWISAAGGSMCGITISFVLGRTLGFRLIHKYGARFGATEARLDKVHRWLEGVGHWGLTFGYFVPGVRHFTALIAGATGVGWHTFALYAYSGAMIWVSVFLGIGYLLGEQWKNASEHAHQILLVLTGLGAIALAVFLWRKKPWRQI